MLGEDGQKEKEDQTALERLEHEAGQWFAAGEGWEHVWKVLLELQQD
jgi:hypothetical protein